MTDKLPALVRNRALRVGAFILLSTSVHAHEEGAPFADAIIDPLLLHHAHIENEQRINFFALRGVENELGRKSSAFESELELAYSSHDFRYGFEFFVPIADIPTPNGSGREFGLGDIEVRPIKYALFQRPWFIVTTASGIRLPAGNKADGLGEGNTVYTQYLFADAAEGNWFVGANLAGSANVTGETGNVFEYGAVVSYSFIRGTEGFGLAKVPSGQKWVISPSMELVGERAFRGPAAGSNALSITPGITFWHQPSGWQIHAALSVPVSGERNADQVFLLQVGNHFNWGRMLALSR